MIITTPECSLLLVLATVLLCFPAYSEGFQVPTNSRRVEVSPRSGSLAPAQPIVTARTQKKATSQLHNLFGNLFGQDPKPEESGSSSTGGASSDNPVVGVFDIPAKVIKIKPLKFFMQILLVGLQNTPFKGAWLMNANEEVEDYLEVYYADGTGMLSVQFDESFGLRIQRKGNRPSLQYMLQESVLLHSILDELEAIAFGEGDGDVKDDERLLQFADGEQDTLSKVRTKLPARAAPEEEN